MAQDSPDKVKAALAQVKQHLANNEFGAARMVLRKLNHPKRDEWIAKVDEREADAGFEDALSSTGEMAAPATFTPAPFTPTAPKKKNEPGCVYRFVRGLVIGLLAIGACSYWLFAQNGSTFSPAVDHTATQMMSKEPENVLIQDAGTTLGTDFLPVLREQIARWGYISWYESSIRDGRLLLEAEMRMADRVQNRNAANKAIAVALSTYYQNVPVENQGYILFGAFWHQNGVQCGENVGAGYRAVSGINWDNVSDERLFETLDKENYSNRVSYGDVAFGVNARAAGFCKP
jgi:hypothetical protein